MAAIKAGPTDGLCYAPNDPRYWDEQGLAKEVERIFDICHGCRLCFNLCPSFPALFGAVDEHDGDVRKLTGAETDRVVDLCYQCKLCYVKCPYTADDGHEFDLDFPRLMLRYNAQKARRDGVGLREKLLGNPVALGKAAGKMAGLANWANSVSFHRRIMESLLGIHRDKKLPEFSRKTFSGWAKSRLSQVREPTDEVVLFHTCFVDYNTPNIGKDVVEVLERNRVRVLSPPQTCCGMPALDGGDVEFARTQAERNVRSLAPYVERGAAVLAINPTCSYMLKKEYVEMVGPELQEKARALSAATRDVCEYLFELKKSDRWSRDFVTSPGEVAYHVPCHLKAQNIGFRSRDMMKTIPGAKIRLVERCCGHDGTWAMKKEHFETSMEVGRPAFDEMKEGGVMATDCPLAAVQFEQATAVRPLHPLQILARAYRGEGFDDVGGPSAARAKCTEDAE
jgi:Fe-S oxidoreductase